jgi:hypothetical protein
MIQIKLELSKLTVREFVGMAEDSDVFMDTVFSSLAEARVAFPDCVYREVQVKGM